MVFIFSDVFIDVTKLKQLISLNDKTEEELLEIINDRYPELLKNIQKEYLSGFCLSVKKQLSLGFRKEFKDIYDDVFLLLNECKKNNEDNFIEILGIIICNYQKEIFHAHQNIGLKIDALPNKLCPRIMVLKDLQNLYVQICESLAKYIFQYFALLCSQIRGNIRLDILNWNVRKCAEYIEATGTYKNLTKYYYPIIRNACAHETVTYNNIDNMITFTDKTGKIEVTGEEFVEIIYNFKSLLDQGCLAFDFYLCSNYNCLEDLLIKMSATNKCKALEYLITGYINNLYLQGKREYVVFDNIHIEKIEFDNNNLKIKIKTRIIQLSELKDKTIYLTTMFAKPILMAIKLFKMEIQKMTFEIDSGDYLAKFVMSPSNLECSAHGIYPPNHNLYFVNRKKKKDKRKK